MAKQTRNKITKELLRNYEEYIGRKAEGSRYLLKQLDLAFLMGRIFQLKKKI